MPKFVIFLLSQNPTKIFQVRKNHNCNYTNLQLLTNEVSFLSFTVSKIPMIFVVILDIGTHRKHYFSGICFINCYRNNGLEKILCKLTVCNLFISYLLLICN